MWMIINKIKSKIGLVIIYVAQEFLFLLTSILKFYFLPDLAQMHIFVKPNLVLFFCYYVCYTRRREKNPEPVQFLCCNKFHHYFAELQRFEIVAASFLMQYRKMRF
jgi:hypothetical protein